MAVSVSPGFTRYWMRTRPPGGPATSAALALARGGGGTEARGMGMISSVPRVRRLIWLGSMEFADAMSAALLPYMRATEASVWPRATTWVRKVTRLLAGSWSRHRLRPG